MDKPCVLQISIEVPSLNMAVVSLYAVSKIVFRH